MSDQRTTGRRNMELPPLRERLADAWPFAGAFFALLLGPFFFYDLGQVLLGWLIGVAVYLLIRLAARRPLYDYISSSSEFGMDERGRVHVLNNEKEAFTPPREWDAKRETREELMKGGVAMLFMVVVTLAMVTAATLWSRPVAVSAFAGGMIVLSIAEPLQQVRGRREFRASEGGVVLDPQVFGPFFSGYVASDRFDPNERTPHIDTVLEAALEHLEPEQRAELLAETKSKLISRAHTGLAVGSVAKLLRLFGR